MYSTIIQYSNTFINCASTSPASNANDCTKVSGIMGDIDLTTAVILHSLAGRFNDAITIVATSMLQRPVAGTIAVPNVLDMNPLANYVQAVVSFVNRWNWTRIGLIHDDASSHHFAVERLNRRLLENPAVTVTPVVQIRKETEAINVLQEVKDYGTHIIVAAARKELLCLLLQVAHKHDIKWPEYAWIVFSLEHPDMPIMCGERGVFILKDLYYENISFQSRTDNMSCIICRYFDSRLLKDSISAISLADGTTGPNFTFIGSKNLHVKFRERERLTNISIVQFEKNSTLVNVIGNYDAENQNLSIFINISATGESPDEDTRVSMIEITPVHSGIVLSVFVSSFIFVTYIYFRKEPEVKATSVPVSFSMFIACYLSLFHVLSLLLPYLLEKRTTVTCNIQLWLSNVSLPTTLIFSTLFVKMLRVYIIFFKPHSYKKKLLSDPFLCAYILLLLVPCYNPTSLDGE